MHFTCLLNRGCSSYRQVLTLPSNCLSFLLFPCCGSCEGRMEIITTKILKTRILLKPFSVMEAGSHLLPGNLLCCGSNAIQNIFFFTSESFITVSYLNLKNKSWGLSWNYSIAASSPNKYFVSCVIFNTSNDFASFQAI